MEEMTFTEISQAVAHAEMLGNAGWTPASITLNLWTASSAEACVVRACLELAYERAFKEAGHTHAWEMTTDINR